MKQLFIFIAIGLFSSCYQQENLSASAIINQSTLPTQLFKVNTEADTVLQTAEGMKIKIAAHSLRASSANVTLQVKEAHTMEEIVRAGLITQSDKGALSSDGMFYIGFAEEVTIQKAMQVSFPSPLVNQQMQLFKGEEKDGSLRWQDPKPIDSLQTLVSNSGRLLFAANCATCHAVDKITVGPELAWIDKRKSREWLHAVVHNPVEVMKKDNRLRCIFKEYNQVLMTSFPVLEDKAVDSIFSYIDQASLQMKIPQTFNPDAQYDSCTTIHAQYLQLLHIRDSLALNNTGLRTKPDTFAGNFDTSSSTVFSNIVAIQPVPLDYYQLNIYVAGWYNIDVLLHNCDGVADSRLMVHIQGNYKDRIQVFLAIPSVKVLIAGGLLDDKTSYGFDETNGNIPLPQSTMAMVFAFSEKEKKVYYAESKFITSLSQTVALNLQESDLSTISASLSSVSLPPDIISKAKNYSKLKELDQDIQKITPAAKKCDCGFDNKSNNVIYDWAGE